MLYSSGPQAYFVHIPSRFSPDGGAGYMAMAANFAEGVGHTVLLQSVQNLQDSASKLCKFYPLAARAAQTCAATPCCSVAPPGLLTRTHCCSQNVDGVQRLKMTAVVSPSGGTYGINLQATQFCGPKAAVPCSSSESAPAHEDDVKVEPLPKRTMAQKPSTLQGFEEHDRSQSFWCEFRALDLIA